MYDREQDIRCEIFLAIVGFMSALIGGVLVLQGASMLLMTPAAACVAGLSLLGELKPLESTYE